MLYSLKRYEVEYTNSENELKVNGIFSCPYHDRYDLCDEEKAFVSEIWDEIPSPRQPIWHHNNDCICFFKEYSCQKWDVQLFAKILFNTIEDGRYCNNPKLVEVDVDVRINEGIKWVVVYEDNYQVVLDKLYYDEYFKPTSYRGYILDKSAQKV